MSEMNLLTMSLAKELYEERLRDAEARRRHQLPAGKMQHPLRRKLVQLRSLLPHSERPRPLAGAH